MVKLPDSTALGQSPTPQPTKRVIDPQISGFVTSVKAFGKQVGQVADYYQDIENEEKVNETLAEFNNRKRESFQGENGFLNRKGANAKGIVQEAATWWDENESDLKQKLTSPVQRRAFESMMQRQRSTALNRIGTHEAGQRQAAAIASADANINTLLDEAANAYDDPVVMTQAKLQMEGALRDRGDLQGLPKDVVDSQIAEHRNSMHKRVLQSLLIKDPRDARAYYEKNKDEVIDRGDIEKALKVGTLRAEAQVNTDEIWATDKTDEEKLADARAIDDADLRDETVRRIKARINETKALQADRYNEALNSSYNLISEGAGVDDIPADIWSELSGKDKLTLQKLERDAAKTQVNDPGTYYELQFMMTNEPLKFKNLSQSDMLKYRTRLTDSTWRSMVNEQQKMIAGETDYSLLSKNQLMQMAALNAGYDPSKFKEDNRKGEELRAFYNRFDQEVRSLGKAPSPNELQEIADRLTIEVIREKKKFNFPFLPGVIPSMVTGADLSSIPISVPFSGSRDAAVNVTIEGIPNDMVDELAEVLQDEGQPVTQQNIRNLYDRIYGIAQ